MDTGQGVRQRFLSNQQIRWWLGDRNPGCVPPAARLGGRSEETRCGPFFICRPHSAFMA